MSDQDTTMTNTAIGISQKRLNGLEYFSLKSSPKVSLKALLDHILHQYGIPELSNEELKAKKKEIK